MRSYFCCDYRMNAANETDILKNILKKAQDDLSVLLDEKRTLMDTVRSLQVGVDLEKEIFFLIFNLTVSQFQLSTDKNLKADGNR